MYKSEHTDFILSPLSDILEEGFLACQAVGDGIESYPLCDYVLQSLFLKLTGAQEQKLKCICWDLATKDYCRDWSLSGIGKSLPFAQLVNKEGKVLHLQPKNSKAYNN